MVRMDEEFMEWAVSRGVVVNGIAIYAFPGGRDGVVAEKRFDVCEEKSFIECYTVPCRVSLMDIMFFFSYCFHVFYS